MQALRISTLFALGAAVSLSACGPGAVCKDHQTGTVAYAGDFTGSSVFTAEVTFMPSGNFLSFTAVYYEVFSGSVAGCGSGTIVFRGTDVLNKSGHLHASFTATGASGDLVNFRGHGIADYNPDLLTGTVTIQGHC